MTADSHFGTAWNGGWHGPVATPFRSKPWHTGSPVASPMPLFVGLSDPVLRDLHRLAVLERRLWATMPATHVQGEGDVDQRFAIVRMAVTNSSIR